MTVGIQKPFDNMRYCAFMFFEYMKDESAENIVELYKVAESVVPN